MPIHSSLLAKPRLLKKLKAFYDHLQKMMERSAPLEEVLR